MVGRHSRTPSLDGWRVFAGYFWHGFRNAYEIGFNREHSLGVYRAVCSFCTFGELPVEFIGQAYGLHAYIIYALRVHVKDRNQIDL